MNKLITLYILPSLILLFLFIGCNTTDKKDNSPKAQEITQEDLIKINKYLLEKDAEEIEELIRSKKWDMIETRTGLWYMIYEHGEGEKAVTGKDATIDYTIKLLDGTLCYSSDSTQPKTFKIGKGGVESGLEEGILLLREGDKARFIMPPHLAHHLLGDEEKIPPRATIIYDLHLLKIEE